MSKVLMVFLAFFTVSPFCIAQDTTWVQTFTFETQNNSNTDYDSPQRQWFPMPTSDNGETYQKILMYHRLKCFEDGTAGGLGFPCGEWDYLTYTYMYDHTGVLDSNLASFNTLLLDNEAFESELVSETDLFDNLQSWLYQTEVVSSDFTSHTLASTEDQTLELLSDGEVQRNQYVFQGNDLIAAGLEEGEIHALQFNLAVDALDLDRLIIRGRSMNINTVETFENINLDLLYDGPWSGQAGWQSIPLIAPLSWNGSSEIVLDIAIEDAEEQGISLLAGVSASPAAISSVTQDNYATFDENDLLLVDATSFDLDEEITIDFWHFGDEAAQPSNSFVFEATNLQGERVLGSHLPWSNGRVYWDAGQENGYDRIDKQAFSINYAGRWNHWAFTKNAATGSMKIYLNGDEWHSGNDKTRSMADIVRFSIGSNGNGLSALASLDDFRVWNVALSEAEIQDYMHTTIDEQHPQYAHLLMEFRFEDAYGTEAINSAGIGNAANGFYLGAVGLNPYTPEQLRKSFTLENVLPSIAFDQGDFDIEVSQTLQDNFVQVPPVSLASYEVVGSSPQLVDISYVQTRDEIYTVHPVDGITNTTPVIEELEITSSVEEYYQAPFEVLDRYELGRFITPYGIGLTLDDDGWAWVYDVTDFAPLLRDSIDLIAGNWQELLDLKFAFIEGTPPRDVKRVENIWNGNFNLSSFDDQVTDKTFLPLDDEEMFVLKTTTSGHGFGQGNNCAEFCFNTHDVQVNGSNIYSWQIMQECAENPLFPQGGTWIYDRAGWCPGDVVKTHNWDLTDQIAGQEEVVLDYDIDSDPFGNYILEAQMITYGAPNHTVDVSLEQILEPTDNKLMSRTNPICSNPKVLIQNRGSETLTAVEVSFGIGELSETYLWEGSLEFLESTVVSLPWDDSSIWDYEEGTELEFQVMLNAVDGSDEQLSNNFSTSRFLTPAVYDMEEDNKLIIRLNTNNAVNETAYTLYDSEGNVVFARDDFAEANENYNDTLTLYTGCYLLHVEDSGQDGLSFFANNDGNGYVRFRKPGGPNLITFENDFGKEFYHAFVFRTDQVESVTEQKLAKRELAVSPVPSAGLFVVKIAGDDNYSKLNYEVLDVHGKQIEVGHWNPFNAMFLDLRNQADGVYHLRIWDGEELLTRTLVKAAN